MHHTATLPHRLRRDGHDGRSRARNAVLLTLARAKRSGGPEDHALYTCHCGFAFKAEVSTSVGCPHCGTHQAW
jgi:hypothetical protein